MKIFQFEDHTIEFDLANGNVMVNATQMAKKFEKQASRFFENEETKMFIKEILSYRNSDNLDELYNQNSAFLNINTEADLFTTKQKSGTWMPTNIFLAGSLPSIKQQFTTV